MPDIELIDVPSNPNTEETTQTTSENSSNVATSVPASAPVPREIWQTFHWAFFINVQALVICLHRFSEFMNSETYESAEVELESATQLLTASGAAMQLAGSFQRHQYEKEVRISMMPPNVESNNFSGIMSWEHATLMVIWRKLRPAFNNLPECLGGAHEGFVRAYYDMAIGHTKVCEKFGGLEDGSIRFDERSGVETLKRFIRNRIGLIDPKQQIKGCPFS